MRMTSTVCKVFFGILALAVVGAVSFEISRFYVYAFAPANPDVQKTVFVHVFPGENPKILAQELEQSGVITNPRRFVWLGRFLHTWRKLKVGEYEISSEMSPVQILAIVTSGKSAQHGVTVKEGDNLFQVAELIEKAGLGDRREILGLCKDGELIRSLGLRDPEPASLEGFLYPDTYRVTVFTTPREIIKKMVLRAQKTWTAAFEQRARELGMSRYEVITLASIIEKETGTAMERAAISSVFHNRLQMRMRLESDPTTIYGMWESYTGNLKKIHLQTPTPYNTYKLYGLPAGPIANPGVEAIRAALYPQRTEFLYFVSMNDGTHQFSRSYEEHQAAVRKYQMDKKNRAGKTWRDLSRSPKMGSGDDESGDSSGDKSE